MKLIETLPYYLVQVRFQGNEIQIYDMISKKVVASEPVNQKIVALRKVEHKLYLALNEKDEIVSEISVSIKLISKKSELRTEAGYILDLHMLSQSHGYYFGYYEMGEFKLTKDAKLIKIRSYPVDNCTKGRINKSSNVYLGCRENSKCLLVKLSWKSNRDPKVLWKKVIPSAVMAMEIIGDRLFIGLKNGSLQLWDIQNDECIKNIKLFSSTFSVSTVKGENITLASRDGDIARISKNGIIQWKNKITNDKIVGIYEDKDYILVINTIGEQFHIKFKSGKIIRHRYRNLELGRNAGLSSSIIKYRERFVITGYGGIWAFRHKNFNNSIHQYMGDPLMRIIRQHLFGLYSGDDNGNVCFWGLGDFKIKVENYKPPLKNSEEYDELKSQSLSSLKKIKGQSDSYLWKGKNSSVRSKFIGAKMDTARALSEFSSKQSYLDSNSQLDDLGRNLQQSAGTNIHPQLKREVQSFLEWIKDSEGLSGYINYYLQQNNTSIISELTKIYAELRQIFGIHSPKTTSKPPLPPPSLPPPPPPKPPRGSVMAPQGRDSYRDQIINLLSAIQRFWPLKNSRIIAVTLVQASDTILYSTDNWDISAEVGRVISSWNSMNAQFIMLSGVKYSVLQCTSERLVATSIRGKGQILAAKDKDDALILHVEPDFGSDDNDDRFPYPYIFTPPNPPDDFEMAPQVQLRAPLKEKDPEEEIYCQFCGQELTKEGQLTHSCKKKP